MILFLSQRWKNGYKKEYNAQDFLKIKLTLNYAYNFLKAH